MWNRGVDSAINPESAEQFTKWFLIVTAIVIAFSLVAAVIDAPQPTQTQQSSSR